MLMSEKEIFNQAFANRLKGDGFPVKDIEKDVYMDQRRKPSPVRVVRRWTGFSNEIIRQGLFNEARDVLQPRIGSAILQIVNPWVTVQEDRNLPEIRAKELARQLGLSAERVIDTLIRYPFSFSVNGSRFQTATQTPEFPRKEGVLTLRDITSYDVSPKRVIKNSRYISRPPGGGPAQKIRFQEKRVDGVLKSLARQNTAITFIPILEEQQSKTDRKKVPNEQIEMLQDIFYFFENKRYNPQQLIKRGSVVEPREIVTRLLRGDELSLFVPWGVRPEGQPRLEMVVMDKLQMFATNLRQKGVNARILIMPADIYATEVNNQVDPSMVAAYFDYVTQLATERGFAIKPWSEIRAENLIDYQTRAKELTDEAIRVLVGVKKMEMAIETAIKRSGYTTLDDVENAALAYLRERIIEAEIIESLYRPVKVSVVVKNRDDIIDGDLPRIYLFPPELQFPWLK